MLRNPHVKLSCADDSNHKIVGADTRGCVYGS